MFTLLYKFLYYIISFVVAAFILCLGIIAAILPWSASVRTDFITLILENSVAISLFGFGFIIVGAGMFINLWMNAKRSYYYVRVGGKSVAVDEEIIQHYLEAYWKHLFPKHEIPCKLILKKNKIKIIADLPYAPPDERKLFIERIQEDLQDILMKILGYSREFVLSVSFQPNKAPD